MSTEIPNKVIELSKPLKEYIKLKEMGVIIHNQPEVLLFLKNDIQKALESMKQKELSGLIGLSEPAMSLMMKFFKSLDSISYTDDRPEFNILYDNTTYLLIKG